MFVEANPETLQGGVRYCNARGARTGLHPPVCARTNLAEITVLKTGLPWLICHPGHWALGWDDRGREERPVLNASLPPFPAIVVHLSTFIEATLHAANLAKSGR